MITGVESDALHALSGLDWPGNIPQLRQALEAAAIAAAGPVITLPDLAAAIPISCPVAARAACSNSAWAKASRKSNGRPSCKLAALGATNRKPPVFWASGAKPFLGSWIGTGPPRHPRAPNPTPHPPRQPLTRSGRQPDEIRPH